MMSLARYEILKEKKENKHVMHDLKAPPPQAGGVISRSASAIQS